MSISLDHPVSAPAPRLSAWKTLIFVATTIVVTWVFGTAVVAWRYFNVAYFPDPEKASLAEAELPASAREIEVATRDGERLVAWYTPLEGRPLVIYLHGDIGNLSEAASRARGIVAAGFSMLAIDYRGYGGSTGTPDEAGLYIDADAAWEKAVELGYTPDRIAIVGESYGAGVALNLANRRPAAAVVVEGAYSMAADLIAERFWGFPARLIMRNRVRSDLEVAKLRTPLLLVHGEDDAIVPIRHAWNLYALASGPRDLLVAPGRGHLVLEDPTIMTRVGAWLSARLDGGAAPARAQ